MDEPIVVDPDHRSGVTLTPDLTPLTINENLGVDPLANAVLERPVRSQHREFRGSPVFVAEFQGREFPLELERGLIANEG